MCSKNYIPMDESIWSGRVDSTSNYDAFRWHQHVKPLNLWDENIKPVESLSFGILGFCCDIGIKLNKGRVGAINGPISIRTQMANFPCNFYECVNIFDAGDIVAEGLSLSEAQELLSKSVARLLSLNIFPIVLGGGHETALGNFRGLFNNVQNICDKPKIGIINFDAHFDLRPYDKEGSSGTMFRQISDICKNNDMDFSYFCVGVQEHSNTIELFKTANKLGVKYTLAKDIVSSDGWALIKALKDFIKNQDYIYVTICSDVFSAAFAPGVSAIQTVGLDPEMVIQVLKHILKSGKVMNFDICEVAPRFDKDNITSNTAAVIIFALVNTICKQYNLDYSY